MEKWKILKARANNPEREIINWSESAGMGKGSLYSILRLPDNVIFNVGDLGIMSFFIKEDEMFAIVKGRGSINISKL